MDNRLRPDWHRPLPSRVDPNAPDTPTVIEAHSQAEQAGQAGYIDPTTGLFVMTATYLAERGYCCGNECRHCPYEPS